MVDCGNARCAQEKKSFKKELITWTKKIPIVVGLERIAEEVGGCGKIRELLRPYNDLEFTVQGQDWDKEENCYYCESRVQCVFEAMEHVIEEAKNGQKVQDNPSMRYLQEILPYCPQFYTQNMGRELLAELKSTTQNNTEIVEIPEDSESSQPAQEEPRNPVELKIPNLVSTSKGKKDSVSSAKKPYTEEELSAAVSDIQNGKLGTRRASVLYGIPRSTLRNKMFRLGVEKVEEIEHEEEKKITMPEKTMAWTDLFHKGSLPFALALPHLSLKFLSEAIEREAAKSEAEDLEKKLDVIRKKHNLSGKKEKYRTSYLYEPKIPFVQELIKRLAEERFEMECNSIKTKSQSKVATEKQLSPKISLRSASPVRDSPVKELSPSFVYNEITIPSYQSSRNSMKEDSQAVPTFMAALDRYENSRIGDTLKDIIMKTITEKVKSKTLADFSECKNRSIQETKSRNSPLIACGPTPPKQIKQEKADRKHTEPSSPTTPTKKTRPKRGQYRKYNSQLLMEAVKAVQRGEMSVHRAGSYYGVPHSTLEYKVKERHLLRQKKIKEQKEASGSPPAKKSHQSSSSKGSSKESSSSRKPFTVKSESSSDQDKDSKDGTNVPWYSPYLIGVTNPSLDVVSNMGFYGTSGFALNTPASELLRKLQHKVQTH